MVNGRRLPMIVVLARRTVACVIAGIVAVPLPAVAQQAAAAPAQQAAAPAPFKTEELDQLLAPIALHPDPLLAQILMASTYPLQVVEAARFVKDNPNLKGDQLDEALKKFDWDDSVKSLTNFAEVLAMMDAKTDWTQKLGDAFLAQQKEVLDAVQRLRAKAQAQGTLKSGPEMTVKSEPAAAAPGPQGPQGPQGPAGPPGPPGAPAQQPVIVEQAPPTVITIQPTNPQVIQVPTYDPAVAYGAWPYPAYPPYPPYYPPGYVAGVGLFSFAAGVAVGGALWGNCDWNGGEVNVNRQNYNNFTSNVNRSEVAQNRTQRQGSSQNWQHNSENRRGTQYRDASTQQRYNRGSNPQATQARENFRGRAEQGRQNLAAGDLSGQRGGGGGLQGGGPGRGDLSGQRGGGGGLQGGGQGRGDFSGQRAAGGGGALQGVGQGRDVQQFSSRGQASRQSSGGFSASRSAGRGSASPRSGGGGARGGGGGRGGGGRR